MVNDTRRIGNVKVLMVGGGGLPEDPLSIAHGGTGNSDGYIRTGLESGTTAAEGATVEGYGNTVGATARNSHSEGVSNNIAGIASHIEGDNNAITSAVASTHVGGSHNNSGYSYQTVVGKYNQNKSGTLLEVGNGTASNARSNAFEVYSDGKISQDNGTTKFKFGNDGTNDGYYDASGTFHAFGGSSGASTLSDLTDTSISSPTNNQLLRYSTSSNKWENASVSYSLSGLSDTDLISPSNGQVLKYQSATNKWINAAVESGLSKFGYRIVSTSWSASANSSGYYTYSLSLNPSLSTAFSPNVYFTWDKNASVSPPSSEKLAYNLMDMVELTSASTIVLYAKTKPTTTFNIFVEGVKA